MSEGNLDSKVVIRSLRLIFWGTLLCVLYTKRNDIYGIGWFLIYLGVFPLAKQSGGINYKNFMLFVQIVVVVASIQQILVRYFSIPERLSLILEAFLGFLTLAGIAVFCMAMRDMAEAHNLNISKASWKTTLVLFIAIYAIPIGLVYLFEVVSIISGIPFYFSIVNRLLANLLLTIFFVPIIHFFISTSRMKREMASVVLS